jgi:isopenicillin-N N-acyltransferase-like protein
VVLMGESGTGHEPIRILTVSGAPRARGRAYGEEARDAIAGCIATWKEALEADLHVDPDPYLQRFVHETDFLPAVKTHTPWVLEEIEGIAEAANLPFATVLAHNLPDEEWWYRQSLPDAPRPGEARACSAIGLRHGPNGHPVASQNMDVPAFYAGSELLVRLIDEDGFETLVLAYAGSTGLCGCNAAGTSICCNTLLSLNHSTTGLPVNCVVRGVLAQRDLDGARAFVHGVDHASGQAYLVGGSNQLAGFECSAGGAVEYGKSGDRLWHTNHPYVSTDGTEGSGSTLSAVSDTERRGQFIESRLDDLETIDDIEATLSDRTTPLCRVPEPPFNTITFGSIVMELDTPPRVWLAAGPPDRTPYELVSPVREPVPT